jgi:lipoate-protein ligase B
MTDRRKSGMTLLSTTQSPTAEASGSLEIYLLGVVDFDSALFLQERLVYEISGRNDTQGALLLCEHPPMITIGREGSWAHILIDNSELVSRQMEVRWLNRGGGCFVHAPGQLAVYPILPLDRLNIGLSDYRRRLEESVIDVCRELRVSAHRRADEPGVWCRLGQFAHLGVAAKSWVAYHGMFLNVSIAMDLLRMVQPNDNGQRVTSLSAQRARVTTMHSVRASLMRNLASQLGYDRYHLYTGHPLLRRTKKKVHVHA